MAVLVTASFISFSFIGKDTLSEGLTIGDKAPGFTICGEKQLMELEDLQGNYVLLSFWASYDAPSRMQNVALSNAASQHEQVKMVSVSFDEFKSVFNETIRKDFDELYRAMHGQPLREIDKVIYTVCTLCRDHERSGFVNGIRIGIRLNDELPL